MRKRFPSASLIEGVGGTTHAGSLSGVACVDNAVSRYLATGAVPKRVAGRHSDLKCPAVPPPDPTPDSSSARQAGPSTAQGADEVRARQLLADGLAAAQHR